MTYPEYVKNCIDRLRSRGFSAYAVGGAVRDSLLGLVPNDWDVATSALPQEVLEVFSDMRTLTTGIKHGTVTLLVLVGGEVVTVEITTFREDGEYKDSRHPESVCFSHSIVADLARRDFTVNAIAYNEYEGIVDAFGGAQDLSARIIRAVGEPERRFSEDALRILRAFRFSARLGFDIEEETYLAACRCASLLENIAAERIRSELVGILSSRGALAAATLMARGDVWKHIFRGVPVSISDLSLARLASACSRDCGFEVRLALLLSELSRDELQHAVESLKPSRVEERLIMRLDTLRDEFYSEKTVRCSDASLGARRFLQLYGDIYPDAVVYLVSLAENETDGKRGAADSVRFSEFLHALENESSARPPLRIADLALGGEDLLPLCRGDRARIGRTLSHLLEQVIADPSLNEREQLLRIAAGMINNNDLI